jgi:hypothetical protein
MAYIEPITRTEEDDIRILIRHALDDMYYEEEGTYVLEAGTDDQRADEKSIERAKRGIATIARLLESLKN